MIGGAFVSAQLGHKYADRVIGVHIHTAAPLDYLSGASWKPEDVAPDERHLLTEMAAFSRQEVGYLALQSTKPQTPAVALNDSPTGLLAWIVESIDVGAIAREMSCADSHARSCWIP